MNLMLHGIGGEKLPLTVGDSLASDPGIIARDMIFDLETALEQLRLIAEDVGEVEE